MSIYGSLDRYFKIYKVKFAFLILTNYKQIIFLLKSNRISNENKLFANLLRKAMLDWGKNLG